MIRGLPDSRNTSGFHHRITPGSLLDQTATLKERQQVGNVTDDWNRSDMDMVTLPNGQTYVIRMSGDQGHGGTGTPPNIVTIANQAGVVNGTEQEWLKSYFF